MSAQHRRIQGFTLLELLVVMAIVSLLVSILLPVVGRAKTLARLRICQSNLRQIYTASFAYALDNKDKLPDAWTLGGYYFRRAPGTRPDPSVDPRALAERYGLAATLDRGGYMPGNSRAWVCPAAAPWMQDLGNTYMFATGSVFEKKTLSQMMLQSDVSVWVRDNYLALPYTSGQRGAPGPGWSIPDEQRIPPHLELGDFFGSDKEGSNVVETDGRVLFEKEK